MRPQKGDFGQLSRPTPGVFARRLPELKHVGCNNVYND